MARPKRTIKRPARFDEDDFSTSTRRRNPHTIPLFPELMAERVVPYQPGHPPAAFPSLPFGPSDSGLDGAHSVGNPANIDQAPIELDQENFAIQVDPEYQTILPRVPSPDEGVIEFMPDHRAFGEKIGSHTQRKIGYVSCTESIQLSSFSALILWTDTFSELAISRNCHTTSDFLQHFDFRK